MSREMILILRVDLSGAPSYEIGDEIWQVGLADAIDQEADRIAYAAGTELLVVPTNACRDQLRDRVIAGMTAALLVTGDTYTATDGITYTLTKQPPLDPSGRGDALALMSEAQSDPVVDEVLRFEHLPVGSAASRRAIVRWSDDTESQALAWYDDKMLICEGDLLGKTQQQLRTLRFRRDRDWLRG